MLLEKLKAGEVSAEGLRIVLEAGIREPMIMRANQALYAQLHPIKESIFWRQVDGGHDALCWRGGLMQGLNSTSGNHFSMTGVEYGIQ